MTMNLSDSSILLNRTKRLLNLAFFSHHTASRYSIMKIYQALLFLLLPLTSNSQACDVCENNGDFLPEKAVNETTICADLVGVDGILCSFLQFEILFSGCCRGDGGDRACSICGDGETLKNPEFVFSVDDPETEELETTSCVEFDDSLVFVEAFLGVELCTLSADTSRILGCECEDGASMAGAGGDPSSAKSVRSSSMLAAAFVFLLVAVLL
jgi:hypothetical protein